MDQFVDDGPLTAQDIEAAMRRFKKAVVERMLGPVGFLLLYLVAGMGGNLWAVFLDPMQVSAGASGAIFGIYGALFALSLRRRSETRTLAARWCSWPHTGRTAPSVGS